MDDKNTISISSNVFELIKQRVEKSNHEFSTVDEYVEFILKEFLEINNSKSYTKEEEEEIKKHLKAMGYI